jgi:hypothetical protein
MLYDYYTNLKNNFNKKSFILEVMRKCKVSEVTVRSWVAKPGSITYRHPKPVYFQFLAKITGIPESELFEPR